MTLVCGVLAGDLTGEILVLGPPGGPRLTFQTDDVGAATAFTTGELEADVQITVPDRYDATLLVDLVPVLAPTTASTPTASPTPSRGP